MNISSTAIGNPPIQCRNTNTSYEADPEDSLKVVDTTNIQPMPERKDNESRGETNAEKKSTKYPNARGTPSAYGPLESIFVSLIHLSYELSILKEHDRYIMSHLGELDDRLDDLESECNKNTDIIRRLQDEIHRLKGESNRGEVDKGVRKAGKRVQKRRKRAREA